MRSKKVGGAIDYGLFGNPWTGLAAMILVQASNDLLALGDMEYSTFHDEMVTKTELEKFFRSKWAWHLATSCGLDPLELSKRGVLTWAG